MSGYRRAHRAVGLDPLCIPYSASRVEMIQGEPVTERWIENWADEAVQGFDLDRLRQRGRKPVGDGPGQVIPVRLDTTLLAALGERADRDYVSRSAAIREAIRAYVELGLARTGKLVTSDALILMFAFLVLSTSPRYEIKPLAIDIAAGIIFDAIVIRALLVSALMRLLGEATSWMPSWALVALRLAGPAAPVIAVQVPRQSDSLDAAALLHTSPR